MVNGGGYVLVMDLGSRVIRIGVAGDPFPTQIHERDLTVLLDLQVKQCAHLLAAAMGEAGFTLLLLADSSMPMHDRDIDWKSVFANCMRVMYLDTHIAACLIPQLSPALSIGNVSAAMSLHVGASTASVMCVADWRPAMGGASIRSSPFSGNSVSLYLRYLLLPLIADIADAAEWPDSVWEDLKLKACLTLPAPESLLKVSDIEHSVGEYSFVVPGWVRQTCTELWWAGKCSANPKGSQVDGNIQTILDRWEECSLVSMMVNLLHAASVDIRQNLVSNIILSGGATQTIGFRARLRHELCIHLRQSKLSALEKYVNILNVPIHAPLILSDIDGNVVTSNDTHIHASCIPWIGASLAGSLFAHEKQRSSAPAIPQLIQGMNPIFERSANGNKADILSYLFAESNAALQPRSRQTLHNMYRTGWHCNADGEWEQQSVNR